MTDVSLASLAVDIDTTPVPEGVQRLHQLADAGGKAEGAMDRLASVFEILAAETRKASALVRDVTQAHGAATSVLIREAEAARKVSNAYADFYDTAQRDFATQYARQLGVINSAHVAGARGAKLQAGEVLNLSRQLADVAVTGAMGMNPLMIAIQQGPQIADIFQTAAGRGVKASEVFSELGGIVGRVLGVAGPFAIGAAVVGTLAAAFLAGEKDANRFANALAITGNFAGATSEELELMSRRVANDVAGGFGKARETISSLVATGKFTSQTIEILSQDILDLAKFTGESAAEMTADFSKMGDGVADFAVKFNDRYHMLTLAQIEHIRLLEEQGRVTDAQLSLSINIHEKLGEIGPANLGLLERAWRGVTGAIGGAWEALKDFGKAAGVASQLAAVNDQLGGAYVKYNPAMKASLEAQKAALETTLAQQKAATETSRVQDAGIAAAERMRTTWAGAGDDVERARREISKYRGDIEAIRKADPTSGLIPSAARQKAAEDAILKKYTPSSAAASSKAASAAESAARASARHAEQLDREARAMVATTEGALATAAAYGVSDAAALRAIATAEATAKAITKRGDADAFVQRQLDLNAAKAAENAARTVTGVDAQNAAQRRANDDVAAGVLTADAANERMRIEATLRPMIAQADAASGKAKEVLTEQIIRLGFAQKAANQLAKEEQLLANREAQTDQVAVLERELSLIGATNRERAVALAILQKEQELKRSGQDKLPGASEAANDAGRIAGLDADLQASVDNYNGSLDHTLDLLDQIDAHTRDAASGMAAAFDGVSDSIGRLGDGIGGLATAFTGLAAQEEAIRRQREESIKSAEVGADASAEAQIMALLRIREIDVISSREAAKARVAAYGDMAAAGRSFFEEGTAGYKALQTAEIAFRALEMVMSIQAMAQKGAEVATHVTAEGVKASASGVAAYARTLASLPFPFNLAAGAVVLASLAAVGVAIGGGRGGGAMPGATDMEDRQKVQGTGSVFGDAAAKSESIARSLEIVAANTNKDLEYSNGMLKALRSIESGIGAVAEALARTLSASGSLDTSKLNLGASTKGPGLGASLLSGGLSALLPGLFGGKTTRSLQDQGLQFGSQSLSDILSGGIEGQTYQQVLEQTTKKFLGVKYSDKSKVSTTTGALDDDLSGQITALIGSLKSGVLEAASVLGVTGAEATLDAFQVNLGKLSFKDMSGAEIQEALNAIFGKLGDDLAATAIPSLTDLQKVGEGAFETLSRVARQYQVVDTSLTSIGMEFGAVGIASLAARERLVDLVGGIEELADQASYFAENFLSDIERMAPIQRSVTAELNRLGLAGITTKDAFKDAVLGLDLTTEAGAKMYAALLDLAPAFAKVIDFQTEGAKSVQDARAVLSDAYEREAGNLTDLRDRLKDLAKSLKDFGASLDPLFDASATDSYERTRRDFLGTAASAATGNVDALGGLQSSAQAFLDAANANAGSLLEYQKDVATVRNAVKAAENAATHQATNAEQQLSALNASVAGILTVNASVLSVRDALAGYQSSVSAQTATTPPASTPTTATPGPTPSANDNGAPAARQPDWTSYLAHYADVAAAYAREMSNAKGRANLAGLGVLSAEQFGALHWDQYGKKEGRTPYADGGAFTNGVVSRPTSFDASVMGEAGPEGILPLANIGGKLGVHASGGASDSAQLAQIHREMVRATQALVAIASSTHEMNRRLRRIEQEGLYVRGAEPEAPVLTKAAA